MEDFVPWVPPISSHPLDWEEEEEENEMSEMVHNFAARKGNTMLASSEWLMPSQRWPGERARMSR